MFSQRKSMASQRLHGSTPSLSSSMSALSSSSSSKSFWEPCSERISTQDSDMRHLHAPSPLPAPEMAYDSSCRNKRAPRGHGETLTPDDDRSTENLQPPTNAARRTPRGGNCRGRAATRKAEPPWGAIRFLPAGAAMRSPSARTTRRACWSACDGAQARPRPPIPVTTQSLPWLADISSQHHEAHLR